MAAGNPSFGNLYATTVDNYMPTLADNYTSTSRLLTDLKKAGNVKPEDGGVEILENLEIGENGSYNRFEGSQVWNLESKRFATAASYGRKRIAVTMVVTGAELDANSGKSRMIDLVASKIKNGAKSLANGMAHDVYSDGTDPLQIGGLKYLVSDTPNAGVVGGIDASDAENAFWRNYAVTVDLDTVDSIPAEFQKAIVKTTRNNDAPKKVYVDNSTYLKYFGALAAQQRFVDSESGEGGFKDLAISGLPVVFDQGIEAEQMEGGAVAKHAYFLNTDYIYLRPHKGKPSRKDRVNSINQDLYVEAFLWSGNMTCSGRAFQGVLIDSGKQI